MRWNRPSAALFATALVACSTSEAPDSEPETPPEAASVDERLPDEYIDRRGDESGKPEEDDASLRREARREWYGTPSVDYMQAMHKAAQLERARWSRLLPSPDGSVRPLAASGSTWVNLGPTNAAVIQNGSTSLNNITDSGRVRSIVIPSGQTTTLYVAFSGGGVWKTTNGGTTWTPKTETVGSLSVGALAIDPTNASTLYLGLGDPFDGTGIGLLKSTNGADTWSGPVFLGNSTQIRDLAVSTNGQVILAATDKGLYRSTNAGGAFALVTLPTGFADVPGCWDLEWTSGTSWALSCEATPAVTSGTTNGQVFTSTNDGSTWTRATGMTKTSGVGRISLAAAPGNRAQVYAMAAIPNSASTSDLADLFRSSNSGATWTAMSAVSRNYSNSNTESRGPSTVLRGQGWYNHALIVSPTSTTTFYFGGALHLARCTSATASRPTYTQLTNWLAQFSLPYVHADFHAAAFDSAGNFYVGSDGGLFKSTNQGTSWTDDLNVGITTHLPYSVGSSPNNRAAVIGGLQDNGTRVRSGTTGTFNQRVGGDGFGSHINQVNAQQMLGSLYYTRIQKSTNGGTSFVQSCSGITECGNSSTAPFLTKLVPWDGDATGNTVFTAVNLKVYKSTNYAGSWTALGTSGLPTDLFIRNVGVARSNGSVVGIAANGGRVFLTSNGGTSWTQAAALPNSGSFTSYVSFDPVNANTVYLASVAPDATKNHLWKSTNLGASWTAIDGAGFPQGVPVNAIVADPTDALTLYAGTHLGLYRSQDGGATWARWGAGLPLVEVTDVYVSPDASLVRVATFGRGFWELTP